MIVIDMQGVGCFLHQIKLASIKQNSVYFEFFRAMRNLILNSYSDMGGTGRFVAISYWLGHGWLSEVGSWIT